MCFLFFSSENFFTVDWFRATQAAATLAWLAILPAAAALALLAFISSLPEKMLKAGALLFTAGAGLNSAQL